MKFNYFLILFFLLLYSPSIGKTLSQENLESDLRYYYNISSQKNLSANDKLYILNRIYDKYKNSKLDLTKLQQEIQIVKNELQKQKYNTISQSTVSYQNVKPITKQEEKSSVLEVTPVSQYKPVDDKYKISSGDVLFVRVSPAEELSKEVIVTSDGKIVLPLVGSVKVDGNTISETEKMLEKLYSVYISKPRITITVKYYSKRQVFIMGEIKNPGGYQYEENLKLLELISKAGGITQYAGKNIKIYRGEKEQQVINVNLEEIIRDISKDILLYPGDIIEVPKQPKTISIIGEVSYPGTYEWYENMDVLKAISLARGYTATAKLSSVKIFRETAQGKKIININMAKILQGDTENNIFLQPGDIIYVPRKPLVSGQWFVNTVLPWLTLISTVLVLIAYVK